MEPAARRRCPERFPRRSRKCTTRSVDGVIENRVDGITLSTWVLILREAIDRSDEALRDLRSRRGPFKEDGTFTWSQCGDSSCLTVSDGDPSDDALIVGVFSQALERGVVKTIVNDFQFPLPPIVPCLGRSWLEAQSRVPLSASS